MHLHEIVTIILLALGAALMLVGNLGLIRLPDFFSRTHAVSKIDSLSVLLLMLALAVFEGFGLVSVKLLLIVLFVYLTNPVGAHILSRAAWRAGVRPSWESKEPEA